MSKQILSNEASGIYQCYMLVIIWLWMWAKGAFEEDTAAVVEKINQALEYAESILSGLW